MADTSPAATPPASKQPRRQRGSAAAEAERAAPRCLVWNTAKGVRQVAQSRPATDDGGQVLRDQSGMVRHLLTQVQCFPGLNLVPGDLDPMVMAALDATDGLQVLRDGLEALPAPVAVQAVQATGDEAVLHALMSIAKNERVITAIGTQLAKLAKDGAVGVRARALQAAHVRQV